MTNRKPYLSGDVALELLSAVASLIMNHKRPVDVPHAVLVRAQTQGWLDAQGRPTPEAVDRLREIAEPKSRLI